MTINTDIGTAAGFSQLTSGSITDLASTLGYNPADWDIREATYKGGRERATPIKSHVFKNTGPFERSSSDPMARGSSAHR